MLPRTIIFSLRACSNIPATTAVHMFNHTANPSFNSIPSFSLVAQSCVKSSRVSTPSQNPLEQALSKSAPHQGAASPNRLLCAHRLRLGQAGVDLDQINSNQATSLMDTLADIVTLSKRQSSAHWGTGGRCPHGVQSVHVWIEYQSLTVELDRWPSGLWRYVQVSLCESDS